MMSDRIVKQLLIMCLQPFYSDNLALATDHAKKPINVVLCYRFFIRGNACDATELECSRLWKTYTNVLLITGKIPQVIGK